MGKRIILFRVSLRVPVRPCRWLITKTLSSSNSAFYQVMFYLPIYLQSIKGQSAVRSGVNTLPFLVFFGVGATVSGKLIEKTRFVQPYQLISTLLMTAGMALFYELKIGSSQAWYIGTEVLFGFGLGFGNSIPITAVQGFSAPPDIPSSTAIMFSTFRLYSTRHDLIVTNNFSSGSIRQCCLLHRDRPSHLFESAAEKHPLQHQPCCCSGCWRVRHPQRLQWCGSGRCTGRLHNWNQGRLCLRFGRCSIVGAIVFRDSIQEASRSRSQAIRACSRRCCREGLGSRIIAKISEDLPIRDNVN